jgi:hypothetical protein
VKPDHAWEMSSGSPRIEGAFDTVRGRVLTAVHTDSLTFQIAHGRSLISAGLPIVID